jgi:integrase
MEHLERPTEVGMASVSSYARKDGGVSYQVKWREGGQWQSETFRSGTTAQNERRALAFKAAVEANDNRWPFGWIRGKGFVEADVPEETFEEFASGYIDRLINVQPRQRSSYRAMVRALVAVEIDGRRPFSGTIASISEDDIRLWLNLDERAAKTLANYHGLLYAVMADAQRRGLIQHNPCERTGVSKRRVKEQAREVVPLSSEQFATLREQAGELADMLTLAVGTGMRMGELAALWVEDIDFTAQTITIRKAWKREGDAGETDVPAWIKRRLKVKHKRTAHYLGHPKSIASKRTIVFDEEVGEALERLCANKEADDFVVSLNGRPIHHANFTNRQWRKVLDRAVALGVPNIHFHDLRHTHASWLIADGIPLPEIQRRLGHESIQITVDTYGHLLPQGGEQVKAAISARLRSRPS